MPPRKSKTADKTTNKETTLPSANNNNTDSTIELVISTINNNYNNNDTDNVNIDNSIVNDTPLTTIGNVNTAFASDLVTPEQFQKGHVNKKRGRKPKGGKIMTNISLTNPEVTEIPNIILHLKCHMNDLKMNNESISNYNYCPSIEEVQSYMPSSNMIQCSDIVSIDGNQEEYNEDEIIETNDCNNNLQKSIQNTAKLGVNGTTYETTTNPYISHINSHPLEISNGKNAFITSGNNTLSSFTNVTSQEIKTPINSVKTNNVNDKIGKEIMKKIHKLKLSFHNSEPVQTKGNARSACFWDTCDFDTQIYFIPTSIINDTFQVYGCFCSPECAIAYLLKEHIDTSTKFERLHLIQLLYGDIYQYGKGLKPAPSPYFLLDKYYGNLSIQEYRQLLKGSQMIYVVNKPLTHILPELYEDNNDFLVNSKVIPTNNMKLKKRYKTMIVQQTD